MHISLTLSTLTWRSLSALRRLNWWKSGLLTLLLKMHLLLEELLIYWLDWLTSIKTSNLFLEVFVLHLYQLNLTFQIENDLFFGVHHDHWLVLDVHGTSGVVQSGDGFVDVDFRWTDAGDHESFGLPTQTILQQHGKFTISERNILLIQLSSILPTKHRNNFSQRKQTFINLSCFFGHYSFRSTFL